MVDTKLHKAAPRGQIHSPINWSFSTATTMRAPGIYVDEDLGGECMRTDTSPPTFWKLVAISGSLPTVTPTWAQINMTADNTDTPLTIFGASLLGWYRGDTVTIGTGVSSWTDKTGNGNHLIQATTGAQPVYTANDATLNNRGTLFGNGSSTFLNCVGMVVPATCWIWIVLKQVSWTSAGKIINWPGSGSIIQTATTPGIQASFSNSTPQNDGAPIGSWKRLIARLDNSTADSLKIGSVVQSGVATGRSASSNNTTLFANWGGGSNSFNGAIAELFFVNRLATGPEAAAVDAYASGYYLPGILT